MHHWKTDRDNQNANEETANEGYELKKAELHMGRISVSSQLASCSVWGTSNSVIAKGNLVSDQLVRVDGLGGCRTFTDHMSFFLNMRRVLRTICRVFRSGCRN